MSDPYCSKEIVSLVKHDYVLFLGLSDRNIPDNALQLFIESVHFPKSRIDDLKRNEYASVNDIALIRTRSSVTFNDQIAPVRILRITDRNYSLI